MIAGVAFAYTFYFVWFVSYYFGSYSEAFGEYFDKGLPEAIEYAQTIDHDKVHVDLIYPNVLFRAQIPTSELVDSENDFWNTHCSDEYCITSFMGKESVQGDIYIGKTKEVSGYMQQYGMNTEEFGYFTVGYY
jgi:hypothetical protein